MMKIIIKTKNLKLNQELENYIQEKIGGLEKFARVFQVKIMKKIIIVVVCFLINWCLIFGAKKEADPYKKQEEDLKLAIVEIKDELQRELKKYKGKTTAQSKRKARVFKKLLHLSPFARFKKRKGGRTREEGV